MNSENWRGGFSTASRGSARVSKCSAVGFGKAATGANYLTIYIWGTVNNVTGVFRSTDKGATWVRVNDDAHEYGGPGNGQFVIGDMNVFGRYYMSTVGRGIAYGEPATVTGIDEDNFTESSSLSAYPNPFETSFKVNVEGEFDYTISDISGKVLSKGKATASQELGASLTQGLYLLQVNGKVIRLIKR